MFILHIIPFASSRRVCLSVSGVWLNWHWMTMPASVCLSRGGETTTNAAGCPAIHSIQFQYSVWDCPLVGTEEYADPKTEFAFRVVCGVEWRILYWACSSGGRLAERCKNPTEPPFGVLECLSHSYLVHNHNRFMAECSGSEKKWISVF